MTLVIYTRYSFFFLKECFLSESGCMVRNVLDLLLTVGCSVLAVFGIVYYFSLGGSIFRNLVFLVLLSVSILAVYRTRKCVGGHYYGE